MWWVSVWSWRHRCAVNIQNNPYHHSLRKNIANLWFHLVREHRVVVVQGTKSTVWFLFYYESRKRELKTILIHEDRCDERLKNKNGGIYTPHIHWVVSFLLSYTRRYVSLPELVNVYQVGLREPIHLCTCVSEEGGVGEGAGSEAPPLLSYTHRYVNLAVNLFITNR